MPIGTFRPGSGASGERFAEHRLIGDALLLPTPIKLAPPDVKPASATQPYWSIWTAQPRGRDAIRSAAEAMRTQLREHR